MDMLVKALLLASLSVGLLFALRMATGQAGRGGITKLQGYNLQRTVITALLVLALGWYIIDDRSIPNQVQWRLPMQVRLIGLSLLASGAMLRTWAHRTLGKHWSADISLREGHNVIQQGPYYWVRHPIYASYWPLSLGLTLSTGNLLIGGLALLYTMASQLRIAAEEDFLLRHLPGYDGYRHETHARQSVAALILITLANVPGMIWELLWFMGKN